MNAPTPKMNAHDLAKVKELLEMADNRLECADHDGGCWRCADLARSYLQVALLIFKQCKGGVS